MDESGFEDALEMIQAALEALSPGQLVHTSDIGMLDLMGAAEIMDSRTDSYLQGSSADLDLPRFDPIRDLSPIELLWVLDEIFRLEMTFHEGNTLGSTIFACQYFRIASLLAVSGTGVAKGKGKAKEDVKVTGARRIVLRAAILGLLKSMEIVFEELFRSLVYEHEDVQLSMAGLTFSSLLASCFPVAPSRFRILSLGEPPEERTVSIDDVFAAMSDANEWIESNVEDSEIKSALLKRLELRTDLIYATAYLSSPTQTTENQVRFHLVRALAIGTTLSTTSPLPLDFAVPPELRSIFRRGKEAPLSSLQPIRVFDPLTLEESWTKLIDSLQDLLSGLDCWKGWNEGTSWEGLREYDLTFARRDVAPYVRSVHQTIVAHGSKIFGSYSIGSLAVSFLMSHLSLPATMFNSLPSIREKETTINSPARKILGWLDKLGHLLNSVHRVSCHNRPRAMRLIMKGFGPFQNLIEEGAAVINHFETLLPILDPPLSKVEISSIQIITKPIVVLLLSQILESLLSGFEFDLYDSTEHSSIYWIAARIANRLEIGYKEIYEIGAGDSYWIEAKLLEARGIGEMCRASWIMTTLSATLESKFSTPFLTYDEPERMAKARFERRFEWIVGPLENGQVFESFNRYAEFQKESSRIRETPETSIELVKNLYPSSAHAFEEILAISAAARGNSINEKLYFKWINSLKTTANTNHSLLNSDLKNLNSLNFAIPSLSPWFPTLTAI